jgi:DNA polymerase-3 subunit delta'
LLTENPELLEARTAQLDDLHKLLTSSRVDRFAYANQFYQHKEELIETLTVWLTYWRDVLQQTTRSQTPLTNLDRAEEIQQIAGTIDTRTAHQATLAVEGKLRDLRTNIEPRLAAEALMLEIPRIRV